MDMKQGRRYWMLDYSQFSFTKKHASLRYVLVKWKAKAVIFEILNVFPFSMWQIKVFVNFK